MNHNTYIRRFLYRIGAGILLFAVLYLFSLYSYLLFHTLAELFSIAIAGTVFILAWNSRQFLKDGFLKLLGVSLLFVGILDLAHTLAYKGMNIFQGYDADLPTQLWIAARYLQSLSLLAALVLVGRRLSFLPAMIVYSLVTGLLLTAIFIGVFPACYIEGVGLTPFKIVSEYIIIGILATSMLLLYHRRKDYNPQLIRFLVFAILFSMLAEMAFTVYVDVYGLLNLAGHYFKIIAFYCIYRAIIVTGFTQPFELLFRDLKEREARLQEYTTRLELSNQELERFARVASHDLQEPLRKIDMFGDRLADSLTDRMDETSRMYLERMRGAAKRMQVMIDALLSYARVTSRAIPFKPVDLQQVVQEVLSDLEARVAQTGGKVDVSNLPVIEADPIQMRQLFQNLIGNALKYHRPNVPPVIRISSQPGLPANGKGNPDGASLGAMAGEWLVIQVQDNGIGIDDQDIERIFKPFERLHGKSEYEGTGIGLAICQKIVERHGGKITAKGVPGQGTTFLIYLPLRQAALLQAADQTWV